VKPAVNKAVAVGALVAVTGAAFLVAFTFFKRGGYAERDSYMVVARFNDATGLTWRSRVQIAGIQIGEVARISLEGARARLDIRVTNDVDLREDACLYKTFPSALLPDALLEVAPGSPAKPSLKDLPEERREITCIREAASVQQLLDVMSKIATDVQTVTGDLAESVRGDQGSLRDVVENLAVTTGRLKDLVSENQENVSLILRNTRDFTSDLRDISGRDKDRIHDILVNVETLTRELHATSQTLDRVLAGRPGSAAEQGEPGAEGGDRSAKADGTPAPQGQTPPPGVEGAPEAGDAKGVEQAVVKLNDSLAKLDDILGTVREGKSTAGKLLVDERMGRQVGNAVEGLADYFDRLDRLQIQLHLRSEALLNQSVSEGRPGAKVYFGARLVPRPDKYYELELVSDPRGLDTITNETTTTSVNGGPPVTTVTTRSRNEQRLAVSLQLAKRYGPLTVRGGLIENSGGIGADLHLFDEQLRFSLSMFQFNRPQNDLFPRAKIWVDWVFLNHFYLTTGADDFLNRWRSSNRPGGRPFNLGTDVFFGLGIEFTDEDIKTLIGAGGASGVSGAGL
jgi:phospholipid/cholesterol/gamma-HCH transport system substrate-binding protein